MITAAEKCGKGWSAICIVLVYTCIFIYIVWMVWMFERVFCARERRVSIAQHHVGLVSENEIRNIQAENWARTTPRLLNVYAFHLAGELTCVRTDTVNVKSKNTVCMVFHYTCRYLLFASFTLLNLFPILTETSVQLTSVSDKATLPTTRSCPLNPKSCGMRSVTAAQLENKNRKCSKTAWFKARLSCATTHST